MRQMFEVAGHGAMERTSSLAPVKVRRSVNKPANILHQSHPGWMRCDTASEASQGQCNLEGSR